MLLFAFMLGIAAPLSAERSVSLMGWWLADRLTDESRITRAEILEQSRLFSEPASFFNWAAALMSEHQGAFSFQHGHATTDVGENAVALRQAWDNRFHDAGMAENPPRFEIPKGFFSDTKTSGTTSPVLQIASSGSLSGAGDSSQLSPSFSLTVISGSVSIGAP